MSVQRNFYPSHPFFYINEKHTEERAAQYLKQVHTSKPIFLEKKINIAFSIVVNYSTPC